MICTPNTEPRVGRLHGQEFKGGGVVAWHRLDTYASGVRGVAQSKQDAGITPTQGNVLPAVMCHRFPLENYII